jgi:hypothetical protein
VPCAPRGLSARHGGHHAARCVTPATATDAGRSWKRQSTTGSQPTQSRTSANPGGPATTCSIHPARSGPTGCSQMGPTSNAPGCSKARITRKDLPETATGQRAKTTPHRHRANRHAQSRTHLRRSTSTRPVRLTTPTASTQPRIAVRLSVTAKPPTTRDPVYARGTGRGFSRRPARRHAADP